MRHRPLGRFGARGNDWKSVVITYRRVDGNLITSRNGIGRTFEAAVNDADKQLKEGDWERIVVSTPNTIWTDLNPRERIRGKSLWLNRYENKIVRVDHSVKVTPTAAQLSDD